MSIHSVCVYGYLSGLDQIGTHTHTDGMNWHTATYRHSL